MRLAILLLLVGGCAAQAATVKCAALEPHIEADTGAHRLHLCEGGARVATYGIRIGKRGVGKAREGDGKTPLGRYSLSAPRPSVKFGTFIGIEYPTLAQRVRGYSGGAVGIHGPHRTARWLGALVNAFDTTDGCIGVARDREIDEIARWTPRAKFIDIY